LKKLKANEYQELFGVKKDTFDKMLDRVISNYMRESGVGKMQQVGVDVPVDEIKESIQGIFNQTREEYRNFIKNNSDFAKLTNSEDKWLERDINFMAHALRNAHLEQGGVIKTQTPFSITDLTALSFVAETVLNSSLNYNIGTLGDTSTVGLELSLFHLSTMEIMNRFGVSDKMRDLLTDYIEQRTEYYIMAAEKAEARKLELNEIFGSIGRKSNFSHNPNIRAEIEAIVNFTKDLYSSDKKMVEILQEIFKFAHQQNKNNPSDFWANFYDNGSGNSTVSSLFNQWETFSQSLEKR